MQNNNSNINNNNNDNNHHQATNSNFTYSPHQFSTHTQYSYDRLYPWPYDYWSYEYRRPLTNNTTTTSTTMTSTTNSPMGAASTSGGTRSPVGSTGSSSGGSNSHFSSPINSPLLFHKGDFMIRVFAQNLNQDVEYTTLHIDLKTTSFQVIENLFKKFRLKDLDPQKYYLTLERYIRKDGLKLKSVMLLNDDSCPLQIQQCCSNPPHKDIKFILQEKSGPFCRVNPSGALRYLSTASPLTSAIRERRQLLRQTYPTNSAASTSSSLAGATTPSLSSSLVSATNSVMMAGNSGNYSRNTLTKAIASPHLSNNGGGISSSSSGSTCSRSSSSSSSLSTASSSSINASSASSTTGSTSESPTANYSSETLMQLQREERKLAMVQLEASGDINRSALGDQCTSQQQLQNQHLTAPPPLWFQ